MTSEAFQIKDTKHNKRIKYFFLSQTNCGPSCPWNVVLPNLNCNHTPCSMLPGSMALHMKLSRPWASWPWNNSNKQALFLFGLLCSILKVRESAFWCFSLFCRTFLILDWLASDSCPHLSDEWCDVHWQRNSFFLHFCSTQVLKFPDCPKQTRSAEKEQNLNIFSRVSELVSNSVCWQQLNWIYHTVNPELIRGWMNPVP